MKLRLALLALVSVLAGTAWAYNIKDTANPVSLYTGSNTSPTISAATNGNVTLMPTTGASTTAYVANGGSFTTDGQYSSSSTSNPVLKVQRSGGAVAGTFGYADATFGGASGAHMYVGTTTAHVLGFRTNNADVGSISASGAWTLGPSGSTATHVMNGAIFQLTRPGDSTLEVKTTAASGNANLRLDAATGGASQIAFRSNGNNTSLWRATTTDDMQVFNSLQTLVNLNVADGGSVTLGSTSSSGATHIAQSANTSTTPVMIIKDIAASDQTAPAVRISKNSNDSTTSQLFVRFRINGDTTDNGGIQGNGAGGVQFFSGSDRRIKQDIADLTGSLAKINAVRPRVFHLKRNPDGPLLSGFIAQEFNDVFPEQVTRPDDGTGDTVDQDHMWTMSQEGLIVHLVKALQEEDAKLEALKADFNAYKAAHP